MQYYATTNTTNVPHKRIIIIIILYSYVRKLLYFTPQSVRKSRDVINTTAGCTLTTARACAHSAAYRPASSHGGGGVVVVVVVKSSPGPPSHARASLSTATAAAAAAVATRAHPHTRTLVHTLTRTHVHTRTPDVRCVAYAVGAC